MKPRSIARRYSLQMSFLSIAGVMIIAMITFQAVSMWQGMRQQETLSQAASSIDEVLTRHHEIRPEEMWLKLDRLLLSLGNVRARIYGPDNQVLYGPATLSSDAAYRVQNIYPLRPTNTLLPMTKLELALDTAEDKRLLNFLFGWFASATVAWGLVVMLLSGVLARLGLQPLKDFGLQISKLDPAHPQTRITEDATSIELAPVIQHFHRLMDKVSEYQEQLRSFNSNVAHELNTPLANLTMSHELLLRAKPGDSEQVSEALHSHLEELQRMSQIIQSMLFLSQLVQGQFRRNAPVEKVSLLVHPVIEYMEASLEERGLLCEIQGDAKATVEPELFKRALSNLLSNAIRYSTPESTIRVLIETLPDCNEVSITVRNTGAAIPQSAIPRIFEPFYRIDDSRTQSQHNHGLGLAIVAAIAKLHDGRVMAKCVGNEVSVGFTVAA